MAVALSLAIRMDVNHVLRRKSAGFTLVELLVASAIGLLLLSAASKFFLNSMQSSKSLMLYSKLQQELRQTGDLMQREIRRAGFVGSGSNNVGTIYLKRQQAGTGANNFDCILYSYNAATTAGALPNSMGFLLDDKGTLWIKTAAAAAGFNSNNDQTCPAAVTSANTTYGTWNPLTSSPTTATASNGVVKITGFDIKVNPRWSTGPIQMSAAASGNVITRASGDFQTDGFAKGDLVRLSGFVDPNNFFQAKISTVTAATMVFETTNSTGDATVLQDNTMAAGRAVDRQGNSLTITLVGQSPKDVNFKSTQSLVVNLFNIQLLDTAN
jgi:prepilin-type N-terminal cleavage/methylation domain-containing protein